MMYTFITSLLLVVCTFGEAHEQCSPPKTEETTKRVGPLNLGDTLPNFYMKTTLGEWHLYDYFGKSWGLLFSHPADFTPVCTTELAMTQKYMPEFTKRDVKVAALSLDSVESHKGWLADIMAHGGAHEITFPIIADEDRSIAVQLGMLDGISKNAAGMPMTARAVYIVGPDRKVKLSILYPASTGRNFDELIRVIDSLQLTAQKKVATPVNWKQGELCVILPSVSNADAAKMFPKGYKTTPLPSAKDYLRFTDAS